MTNSSDKPIVVVGEGWAALGAVGFLAHAGTGVRPPVRWISGSGTRILAPLPSVDVSDSCEGAALWKALAENMGVECGDLQAGSFLREYRNKGFREFRNHEELTWGPERRFVSAQEGRFEKTLGELEESIRQRLASGEFQNVVKTDSLPIAEVKIENKKVRAVILGSGEEIECDQVIYADKWSELAKIQGLPKPLPFTRRRLPTSVVQMTLFHQLPVGVGLMEGFFAPVTPGNLWGYFSSDGRWSVWTLCLSPDDAEDNHEIAKKLRRMKNMLQKIFSESAWLAEGKSDFLSNVQGEQVRFGESLIFAEGDVPSEPLLLPQVQGIRFLTDGYGPSAAFHQVGALFQRSKPKAEYVNRSDSVFA